MIKIKLIALLSCACLAFSACSAKEVEDEIRTIEENVEKEVESLEEGALDVADKVEKEYEEFVGEEGLEDKAEKIKNQLHSKLETTLSQLETIESAAVETFEDGKATVSIKLADAGELADEEVEKIKTMVTDVFSHVSKDDVVITIEE